MSVSIVVPFNPGDERRDRNWAWLRRRYEELYPDWEIVDRPDVGEGWSKGRALNAAVRASSGDVLAVLDADVMLGASVLPEAVRALEGASWVIPHGTVWRLTEGATQALIDGRLRFGGKLAPRNLARRPRKGPPGGGAAVLRRNDFEVVGGIDERFTQWGGEDISFARAVDTLIGPHLRMQETLWHLYHRPMDRRRGNRASEANEELAARYLEATGDAVAMADLCEHRPYQGLEGGGAVVARRELITEVPVDPLFEGWGQEDEAWGLALNNLAGPATRQSAPLVHLSHAPQERATRKRGSAASWARYGRYRAARGDPEAMRALLKEAEDGAVPTAEPAGDDPRALRGER